MEAIVGLLGIGLLLLTGCAGVQAMPPRPTRTPLPTFTPVIVATLAAPKLEQTPVTAPSEPPISSAMPVATPVESPVAPAIVESTSAPLPTPTIVPYSSPAAAHVPKVGRAILIDQDRQEMYIFEDGVEIRAIPCSTGIPDGHLTPPWSGEVGDYVGTFYSFGTYADYGWFLFRHNGSILIHGAPYVVDETGQRAYIDLDALGRRPSSHGCIRIHPDEARWFTFWNPKGVPVIITPWTGGVVIADASRH